MLRMESLMVDLFHGRFQIRQYWYDSVAISVIDCPKDFSCLSQLLS